jgi:serine/threonine-protein kinase
VETADTSAGRFTKVEEQHDQSGSGWSDALTGLLAPQTLALAGAVLLLVLGGWYMVQPPSADDLYGQIETATADGEVASIEKAQPQIESFLDRYPGDPRAEKLRGIQEELKLSNPVQRLYTEARRYTLINPELALTKFQALIDVYDDEQASEATRHWVKQARIQQKQLQKRINQYVADGQTLLESRLAKAAEIAPQNPAGARKIYQGIVELYDEKPWAAEFVQQAKSALATSPDPQAAAK